MIFLNFFHCELLKARPIFLSSPTPQTEARTPLFHGYLLHQIESAHPSNSLTKASRLEQLFPEGQDYDSVKSSLEGHPKRRPLIEPDHHQKVRDRYAAALALMESL